MHEVMVCWINCSLNGCFFFSFLLPAPCCSHVLCLYPLPVPGTCCFSLTFLSFLSFSCPLWLSLSVSFTQNSWYLKPTSTWFGNVLWCLMFVINVLSCSYTLSCEIEGLGDSSPTSPKPRKSMVKRLSLWVQSRKQMLAGGGSTLKCVLEIKSNNTVFSLNMPHWTYCHTVLLKTYIAVTCLFSYH